MRVLFFLWLFWPEPWDLGHYGTPNEHTMSAGWFPRMVYDHPWTCEAAADRMIAELGRKSKAQCLPEGMKPSGPIARVQ